MTTEVNTNTFKGPNQGAANGYIPLTVIESGKVDADLTQIKNDLDYHVAVLQSIYNKLDTIETGATVDQDALDIVTRINASNLRIDAKNLATTVAQLVDITNALNTHIATTTQSAMHNQTSIKSTGLTYSNTPSTVITACNNLLDEIKNVRYQIHRMNGKNTWVDTPDSSLTSLKDSVTAHTTNTSNPHVVTKSQVGLGNVDNIKQATKTEFNSHTSNVSNPHGVTKSQVGLGNVDNIKQATKTEFDSHTSNVSNPHGVTKSQVGLGSVDNAKQATKTEFDTHVNNSSIHQTRYTNAEAVAAINADANHSANATHNYQNVRGNVSTVSSNLTVGASHYTILVSATSGVVTITLPSASANTGRILNIKKMDSSINAVCIQRSGSDTIDGRVNYDIIMQYQSITVQSTGTEWVII